MNPKAVVLLSGGLDSATALAVAIDEGFDAFALSFFYGQRHQVELDAASRVAKALGAKQHKVLSLDMRPIGGSALTGNLAVPKDRPIDELSHGIPITYVPARNTVFLSCALAWAEVLESFDIFIGVNALDYSGYPDCRPEFVRSFEQTANLATRACVEGKGSMKIHAPLMHLTKAQIIRLGLGLGVDYSLTHSCYDPLPGGKACGHCDSCILRSRGFAGAGLADPAA
ncbi:MAG: 7-cyano-7-deazaguanine synthase QueC [Desulfatibacillaceae bacterium]|nr:7-cyano-7-deazaguanine synthase QueC [Desulfatibacillaceae bacterium]